MGAEAARKARRQGVYAAYVIVLFGAAYGFPLVQAVFRTSDTVWFRQQLSSPVALAVFAMAVATILGFAYWSGRFRGPVVPPLQWIDLVLPSPIDRALAVRRWWRFAAMATSFVGGIGGLVLGAGLSFAQVTGPLAIAPAAVLGTGLGVLTARLWLAGQVDGARPAGDRRPLRVVDALRTLDVESLRGHSANTSTLAGSAYGGNLRTARLAIAPRIRRGRSARLRPGRPFWVIVRRDLLGLRRQPNSVVAGVLLAALGAMLLGWGVAEPAVPILVAALGMVPLYLGFGTLAEGLRLQADNVGSASLIGVADRTEALAHLVLPAAATLGVLVLATGAASAGTPSAVLVSVPLVLLLAGGHLLAAFRGAPNLLAGPMGMVFWYLQPGAIVILVGTLLAYAARSAHVVMLAWSVAGVAGVVLWGLVRVRRLTLEHRV